MRAPRKERKLFANHIFRKRIEILDGADYYEKERREREGFGENSVARKHSPRDAKGERDKGGREHRQQKFRPRAGQQPCRQHSLRA